MMNDKKTVLVGDKTGSVYKQTIINNTNQSELNTPLQPILNTPPQPKLSPLLEVFEEPKLLLAQPAMLTDMVFLKWLRAKL